jgi:hypothetical protein
MLTVSGSEVGEAARLWNFSAVPSAQTIEILIKKAALQVLSIILSAAFSYSYRVLVADADALQSVQCGKLGYQPRCLAITGR